MRPRSRAADMVRSLRWTDLQLLVLLPAAYEAVFPRLGPLSWAFFHFCFGLAAVTVVPALAYINLVWLGFALWTRENVARAATYLLLGAAIVATDRTWRHVQARAYMAEAPRVVERALGCRSRGVDWYERGAEVTCERTTPTGRTEILRTFATNGPWPWSRWNVVIAQVQ